MDEDKLRAVVKEVVSEAVEPLKKQLGNMDGRLGNIEGKLGNVEERLDDPDTGLTAINRRLDANTAAVMKLEETVNGYGDMYKINDSNIRKMEKRLEAVEENDNIDVPPEYQLEPLA